MSFHLRLQGRVTPAGKARSDFLLLPFTLPPGQAWLEVGYAFTDPMDSSEERGGNVVDIGLFDPRGSRFPAGAGFRGWSGSRRRRLRVGPSSATPGYLPGPLPAGQWQVILGLYKIADQGCHYELEIKTWPGEPPEWEEDLWELAPAGVQPTPAPAAPRLYKGDLQSHTWHSDGAHSLPGLVELARTAGLDFLAITDHNTTSHVLEGAQLQGPPLVIPAYEVTTYYGHANAWGVRSWCDFRCRSAADFSRVAELVHAQGGLLSVNHPKPGGPAWTYGGAVPFDCMEVWQAPWSAQNEQALAFWEELLLSGRRTALVGGSDYHRPTDPGLGQPATWLRLERLSEESVLGALRAGRAFVSASPGGPCLEYVARSGALEAGPGSELTVRGQVEVEAQVEGAAGAELRLFLDRTLAARVRVSGDAFTSCIAPPAASASYLRLELRDDGDGMLALTNPLYLKRSRGYGQRSPRNGATLEVWE